MLNEKCINGAVCVLKATDIWGSAEEHTNIVLNRNNRPIKATTNRSKKQ